MRRSSLLRLVDDGNHRLPHRASLSIHTRRRRARDPPEAGPQIPRKATEADVVVVSALRRGFDLGHLAQRRIHGAFAARWPLKNAWALAGHTAGASVPRLPTELSEVKISQILRCSLLLVRHPG